jgi:hypothetical protein
MPLDGVSFVFHNGWHASFAGSANGIIILLPFAATPRNMTFYLKFLFCNVDETVSLSLGHHLHFSWSPKKVYGCKILRTPLLPVHKVDHSQTPRLIQSQAAVPQPTCVKFYVMGTAEQRQDVFGNNQLRENDY